MYHLEACLFSYAGFRGGPHNTSSPDIALVVAQACYVGVYTTQSSDCGASFPSPIHVRKYTLVNCKVLTKLLQSWNRVFVR